MSTIELRLIVKGQQVQTVVNPGYYPSQGSYVRVPFMEDGVIKQRELFVSKTSTSFSDPEDAIQLTVVLCECVDS